MPALYHRLFENVSYRALADQSALARYQEANRLAARYCRGLLDHLGPAPSTTGVAEELRRFYRLNHRRKLRHIQRGAGPNA